MRRKRIISKKNIRRFFDIEPIEKSLTKAQAIKIIKKHYWPYCSCGKLLVSDWDGDVTCLVLRDSNIEDSLNFNKLMKLHTNKICGYSDLAIAEFLIKTFNIKEKELKNETNKKRN